MADLEEFLDLIFRKRDEYKMNNHNLAEESPLSYSTIDKIEKGETKDPRCSTLDGLAKGLGFDGVELKLKEIAGAIIFDVDDTLIERKDIPEQLRRVGKQAIREAQEKLDFITKTRSVNDLEEAGCFSESYIRGKYGNSIPWYIDTWLKNANMVDGPQLESIKAKYVDSYHDSTTETILSNELYPEVKSNVKKLYDKGYKLGLVSNTSKEAVKNYLREHDLLKYFQRQVKDYESGHSKVEFIMEGGRNEKTTETLEEVLNKLRAAADNAYLCSDSVGDIQKGLKVGIPDRRNILVVRKHTDKKSVGELPENVQKVSSIKEAGEYIIGNEKNS